jgi:type II secretory pathway pseudopilin PulG
MNRKGFSPLETLIAMIIIVIFIWVLAYKYYSLSLESNISVARTEIKTLKTMIKFFKFQYGRYPKNLMELVNKKMINFNEKDGIKRKYIDKNKLIDPFGNYYIYDNNSGNINFNTKTLEIMRKRQ